MRTVAAVVLLALSLWAAGAARAATVPLDAFGVGGDQRVQLPPFESSTHHTPIATVAGLDDVDGDGLDDTAIVLDTYDPVYGSSAWVTFSPAALPSTVAAGAPGWRGFRIVADRFQIGITGLGDVNGDGLREVAVPTAGNIAVVFGRTDGLTVDLRELGAAGFWIRGAAPSMGTGFGNSCCGSAWQNTSMISAGDQNRDGREDLAFADGDSAKVAFSPVDPAGKEVFADDLGAAGFTLQTGARPNHSEPHLGRLGDLDGDGREDLLAVWDDRDDGSGHAAAVTGAEAGESVDLRTVADRGRGFELHAPQAAVENGLAVGDQNGDGRRDVVVVTVGHNGGRGRTGIVAFSPPLGAERTIQPPAPGEGVEIGVYDGNVIDVGDQDGDGRADLGFSNVVRYSADGRIQASRMAGNPAGPGGAAYLEHGAIIVGSLRDRTGDGRRELVAVHADPFEDHNPPFRATYWLDVFASAPAPVLESVAAPVDVGGAIDFAGSFVTAPQGGLRTLGARPIVELTGPDGRTAPYPGPGVLDANGVRTEARVRVDARAAGLVPGATYGYRLLLENGRGLVGASARRSFTFRPSGATGPRPSPPALVPKPERRRGMRLLVGTDRADRLLGTSGRDLLRGRGGNDRLRGGRGDDRLEGGAGSDRLHGGPGRDRLLGGTGRDVLDARDRRRDVVLCGPGRDAARVDRRDRVAGCERVRRR